MKKKCKDIITNKKLKELNCEINKVIKKTQ